MFHLLHPKVRMAVQQRSLRYFFKGFSFIRLDDSRVTLFKHVRCEECETDLAYGAYTVIALDDRALMHEGFRLFIGDMPPQSLTVPYDVDTPTILCAGCRELFLDPAKHRGFI